QLAEEAFRSGRPDQALDIQKKLVEQYRKYTDLADLFPTPPPAAPAQAPGGPTLPPPSESRPAGPPAESSAPAPKPGAEAPADAQPAPSDPAESVPKADRPQASSDPDSTAILRRPAKSTNTPPANSVVND